MREAKHECKTIADRRLVTSLPELTLTERVAAEIVRRRGERALSQAALATKAKINRVTLARIELGVHRPTLDTLDRISRALGVELTKLLRPKRRR